MINLCIIDWQAASAIASFVMIVVTSVSILVNLYQNKKIIESNERECKVNRDTQVRLIKYQTRVQFIERLKLILIESQDLLSFSIEDEFRSPEDSSKYDDIIAKAFSNCNRAKRQIAAILYGGTSFEKSFLNFFENFTTEYLEFVFDLKFLYSLNFEENTDILKEKTRNYKDRFLSKSSNELRIWDAIESRNYGTTRNDYTFYRNSFNSSYQYNRLEEKALTLLNEEYKYANSILSGTVNE